MLTQYIEAAMRYIEVEEMEDWSEYPDQRYIGTIPPCQGVIGHGETPEACITDTREALESWILVGVKRGMELPTIDAIDYQPRRMGEHLRNAP